MLRPTGLSTSSRRRLPKLSVNASTRNSKVKLAVCIVSNLKECLQALLRQRMNPHVRFVTVRPQPYLTMLYKVSMLPSTTSVPVIPQAPCPPCLDPLPSFLNRSCREDVLGGKFNCSLGRRLDGLPLPVLLLLDFGDGGPRNQMLDREFLFVGM